LTLVADFGEVLKRTPVDQQQAAVTLVGHGRNPQEPLTSSPHKQAVDARIRGAMAGTLRNRLRVVPVIIEAPVRNASGTAEEEGR
jgi:hypothetical protein